MKKNVYFVQVDVSASLGTTTAYLPYTGGILMASAFEDEKVKELLEFKEFIFLREDINAVVERLDEPFIMAFSCYCWNTEYNKLLAEAVKEKYPECNIIFGGHNITPGGDFFNECPVVDILQHGEGEISTRILFRALAEGRTLENVPGISYKNGSKIITNEAQCAGGLDFPSPYTGGWFDDIIKNHPEITFNAILETSRGCPNKCAYCDWGLLQSKVRFFPTERIKAEIKWMSDNKIAFVWGADANFGLFDRDIEIAKELAKAKRETGYPEKMRMNYAKNRFENVFEIVKIFKECDFDRIGATLSFQSLNPVVLENIGRRNSDIQFYKDLLTKYNTNGMKTYSELILGLPGETYESFIHGIGTLFEIGQHFVFEVYGCILLPNATMGRKDYIEKHGIKTVRSEIVRVHFANDEFSVPEYNNIIYETSTMSREMWVRSTVFYYLAKALHGNGLLRAFAIYLYSQMNVPYERFYDGILSFAENNKDTLTGKLESIIKAHADALTKGEKNTRLMFEPCGDILWDDHEYTVLRILNEKDRFYDEIKPYLESFGIDGDIFADLWNYQTNIMRMPCEEETEVTLNYDIHGFMKDAYVNNLHAPEKLHHILVMKDSSVMPDWKKFGKFVIWYGRMGWSSYKDGITYKNL